MRAPAPAAGAPSPRQSPWPMVIGVVVCLVVPLASWVADGHGRLAFTMYASTVDYRLDIAQLDNLGARHAVGLTEVARNVSFDWAAPFLAGAETYRTVPQIDALRDHLRDVARAACRNRSGSIIEIALHERPSTRTSDAESADRCTTERVTCPIRE